MGFFDNFLVNRKIGNKTNCHENGPIDNANNNQFTSRFRTFFCILHVAPCNRISYLQILRGNYYQTQIMRFRKLYFFKVIQSKGLNSKEMKQTNLYYQCQHL